MKKFVVLSILAAAGAAHAQEIGRVISSTPVIQQVAVPRQTCTQQQVAVQQPNTGAGGLMGAIAGGAVGNQIGSGSGRAAATVLGVLGGVVLGDRIEGGGATHYQNAQHCRTEMFYENRAVSYNVIYEYAGKQYSVNLPHDPGPSVQLQISPIVPSAPAALPAAPQVNAPAQAPMVEAPAPSVIAAAPTVVVPAVYPTYYASPYYHRPPVSLHLGFFHGHGHRHHHHRHHRH
jgi:uncharacterized protein YcfJ